jgi:hypothetical protein
VPGIRERQHHAAVQPHLIKHNHEMHGSDERHENQLRGITQTTKVMKKIEGREEL